MSPIRLRSCLAALSLSLVTLVGAQEQPKVTLTMSATKTTNVAHEITKRTGVSIICDVAVGDVPILVSVTDVPLELLLQKIAQATGGEVQKRAEGYLLARNDKARTEQANRETQWATEAFERAKKRIADNDKSPARYDDATLQDLIRKEQEERARIASSVNRSQGGQLTVYSSGYNQSSPATVSAKRVLQLIPASLLASVSPGDRIVYSTAPNRMQRRMPFNVQPIVSDFVYNHNALAKAAPQLQQQSGVNIVGGLTAGEPIQGVAETHVVLTRGYQSATINVEIKFADRNGIYVGQGSTAVSPEYQPVNAGTSADGKVIELSELSRQMAVIMAEETASPTSDRMAYRISSAGGGGSAFVSLDSGTGVAKQFPDELLNVFVNPDRFDPASLYVSECYIQTAKAEGKNLVATFPDTIVRDLARVLVRGNVTHKAILAAAGSNGLQVDSSSDWMIVTPIWANNARTTRFNRDQAGRLFRAMNSRGFATLEELADYSFFLTTGAPGRTLDAIYMGLVNKDVANQFSEYASMNLDLLRLYGTVSTSAKRQSGERMQFAYRTLTGQARTYADRSYYNRPTGFQTIGFGGLGARQEVAFVTATVEEGQGRRPPANSVVNEPTEALPNGIPGEALIHINRTAQDGVFASTKGVRGGQLLNAQELGMRQGMIEANFNGGTPMAQYDTFVPAQILSVEVALDLLEYGRPSAFFKDGWTIANSRAVGYAQLPEAFRAQVEKAKQGMFTMPAEIPATIRGRSGGGG